MGAGNIRPVAAPHAANVSYGNAKAEPETSELPKEPIGAKLDLRTLVGQWDCIAENKINPAEPVTVKGTWRVTETPQGIFRGEYIQEQSPNNPNAVSLVEYFGAGKDNKAFHTVTSDFPSHSTSSLTTASEWTDRSVTWEGTTWGSRGSPFEAPLGWREKWTITGTEPITAEAVMDLVLPDGTTQNIAIDRAIKRGPA